MKLNLETLKTGLYASLVPALLITGITLASPSARACRDCPFPMKIGEHKWLMPNRELMLIIVEEQVSDTTWIMTVTLEDTISGDLIAEGHATRSRDQHEISVSMRDRSGHKVKGYLTWADVHQNGLQADFEALDATQCPLADN